MAILENHFTVSELAERHKKTTSRIRQIALEHDLGTCINNRIRLFSSKDAKKIEQIIGESGRNRKNSEYSG